MINQSPWRYNGIFIVALTSIAYEIFLTRHFAITNWSEYGYWIISIAMVGFSLSGVVICLSKDFFLAHYQGIFLAIPPIMTAAAVLGFGLINDIGFNPLELQNAVLWDRQLLNIGKCYLALFPFFFAAGLYVGLCFLVFRDDIPTVYKADLVGAGLGAILLLGAMFIVHPFYLLAVITPILCLALPVNVPPAIKPWRNRVLVLQLILVAGGQWWLWTNNNAAYCQYKSISTALNVENNRIIQQVYSPKGYYQVLENYNERLDVDLSNNYELLGAGGPPGAHGLYKDGDRLSSFPRHPRYDTAYIKAALDAFPYTIRPGAKALLLGGRGAFRVKETLELGASRLDVLEPDQIIYHFLQPKLNELLATMPQARLKVAVHHTSPQAFLAGNPQRFEVIDVSSEFLDQGQANKYTFTEEGLQELINSLSDKGVVSLPVAISEFTVYAIKTAGTVKKALTDMGLAHPERHVMVYRSSWNARILISRLPWAAEDIAALQNFCSERSFDTSFFPGLDPATLTIWNDLPAISFEDGTMASSGGGPRDSLMDELLGLFASGNRSGVDSGFFNLAPSTYDRPFFYSILRLSRAADVLKRIDIIPRPEMGNLINLAVLFQAIVFALLVLVLPLIRRRALNMNWPQVGVSIVYFMCLGLGFLFIEITLIERFTFFLNDAVSAFAIVLCAMLIFSGLGSGFSNRFVPRPARGIRLAGGAAVVMIALFAFALSPLLNQALHWPMWAKTLMIIVVLAPLSFALGMPFPLGLSNYSEHRAGFLPWAWSINGAFSVIATPLANILAVSYGYSVVFGAAAALYLLAALAAAKLNSH